MSTIKITQVEVADSGDADNRDEVILICQSDAGAPVRVPFKPGSSLPSNQSHPIPFDGTDYPPVFITFDHTVTITVYDQDSGAARGTNDFGGAFWIDSFSDPGEVEVSNGKDGSAIQEGQKRAAYKIKWEWADTQELGSPIDSGELAGQISSYLYETRRQAQAAVDPVNSSDQVDPSAITVNEEFVSEAQQAVSAWMDTDSGKDFLARITSMSQPEVIAGLEKMINHELFNKVAELAASGVAVSDVPDTTVNSIFVTASLQLAAGFGVAGSVTYAIDPNLRGQQGAYYTFSVAGTLAIGPEIEAEVGVEFGIASATPDGMGGLAVGGQLSISDGIGVSGSVMFGVTINDLQMVVPDFSNWSVGVGPAGGAGIGGAALVSYGIVILDREVPAIAQPAGKYMMQLIDVFCDEADDGDRQDEIRLGFNLDYADTPTYHYPTWGSYSIKEDTHWKPGLVFCMDSRMSLSLEEVSLDAGNWVTEKVLKNSQFNVPDTEPGKELGVGGTLYIEFDEKHGLNEIAYKLTLKRIQ